MAINYTASLGLGKPVTGTESGTWGDDVNNAITSYLDIAVAGTLNFNGDGAVTLSQTFGTSSATNIGAATAQYMVLRFTGTTTTKVVTAPSVSKLYLIDNATGHGVTIKASGQTGYTVAANSRAWVFFNGTDYQYATTTETGVTPATSGGTGQSSYAVGDLLYADTTTTLDKLAAVADGSVLKSAGVNTAPEWGAVDLTTDVTGVLPAANGGTGVSVFPAPGTLGNVLYSDGANWTAAPVALGQNVDVLTSGSGFFTIPAGVTRLKATVVGGGGGSSGALSGGTGRGGGGGGTAIKWLSGLTPGNTIAYSVGGGGTAGTSTGNGGNGSASTISSGTQIITTVTGGGGAGGDLSGGAGGNGGTATNGNLNISGTNGNNASSGSSLFSSPIVSTLTPNFVIIATAGNGYGGGSAAAASVSSNTAGAAGAGGVVIFEW